MYSYMYTTDVSISLQSDLSVPQAHLSVRGTEVGARRLQLHAQPYTCTGMVHVHMYSTIYNYTCTLSGVVYNNVL